MVIHPFQRPAFRGPFFLGKLDMRTKYILIMVFILVLMSSAHPSDCNASEADVENSGDNSGDNSNLVSDDSTSTTIPAMTGDDKMTTPVPEAIDIPTTTATTEDSSTTLTTDTVALPTTVTTVTTTTIKKKKTTTTTTTTTSSTTTTILGADAVTILEARCFGQGDLLQVKAVTSKGSRAILTVSNNVTGAVIGTMVSAYFGKNIFVLYKSKGLGNCPESVKVTSSKGGVMVQDVNIIELEMKERKAVPSRSAALP
jgi:hypothetical protein